MSEPSEPSVSERTLRDALRRAIRRTSLRKVAKAVVLSPRSLGQFIEEETRTRPSTLRKLRAWYVLHGAEEDGATADQVSAALGVLLEGLGPGEREDTAGLFLSVLEHKHRKGGKALPGWIAVLRGRGM